jgi:hypothetical protein
VPEYDTSANVAEMATVEVIPVNVEELDPGGVVPWISPIYRHSLLPWEKR